MLVCQHSEHKFIQKGQNMLKIEEIRERLSDRNLSEVARRIGITGAYLAAIASGERTPSYAVLVKISDYLEGK